MGNVLRDQGTFFSIPAEFVESGCLRDISPSAVRLYVGLYYFAQKHSAVRLEFSNAELQRHAGLDTKSIQTARTHLCEYEVGEPGQQQRPLHTPFSWSFVLEFSFRTVETQKEDPMILRISEFA